MKKIYILLVAGLMMAGAVFAQEKVNAHLAEASASYTAGDLEATRFALQQSLNELYVLIGEKILAEMPEKLGDLTALEGEDAYNGYTLGFSGVYIDRTYQSADGKQSIQITLINDSPLLSGLNAFLSSPLMAIAGGRKLVKLDGYKSSLEKGDDEPPTFTINTPFGQSLLTSEFNGFDDENQVLALARQIPIAKIVAIAQ